MSCFPSGILFSPGIVVAAAVQPATHHPQVARPIVHRVAVLVVDVFAITLPNFAGGDCFSSCCVSMCTRLFRFCRALILFVLHLIIASKGHSTIVPRTSFCLDGNRGRKKNKNFLLFRVHNCMVNQGVVGGGRVAGRHGGGNTKSTEVSIKGSSLKVDGKSQSTNPSEYREPKKGN